VLHRLHVQDQGGDEDRNSHPRGTP
jgi:hypothetical protein